MKYIKLDHELVHAKYDEPLGKWKLRILRGPETAREEFEDTADVFFAAVGTFNRWHWPDIPGLNDFKGRLVHSANWDVGEGLNDWSDKRIGVIGAVRLSSASVCISFCNT
jgi:cation diffusion facilitator CzcD-associated flavoprotein CzcO